MKHEDEDREFLSGLMDGEWRTLDVGRSIAALQEDERLRAKWSRYHLARQAMRGEALVPTSALAARVAEAVAAEPTYSNVTVIGGAGGVPATRTGAADAPVVDAGPAGPETSPGRTAGGDDAVTPVDAVVARPDRMRTFAAGFGLAASVAVVTALGLEALDGGAPAADARIEVASSTPSGPAPEPAAAPRTASGDPFSFQVPGVPLPDVELVANTVSGGPYWTDAGASPRRADSEKRLNLFLSQHIENSPTSEQQGMLPYSRLVGYAGGSSSGNRLQAPTERSSASDR